jgi:predicted Zn finger-like uncharacterized protein
MPIGVQCPQCGTHYQVKDETAGARVRCRLCGCAIRIPGAPGPPTAPQGPAARDARVDRDARQFETRRKTIGVFHVVVGALDLGWAGLLLLVAFSILSGDVPQNPGDPPAEVTAAVTFGFSLLSAGLGVLQLAAGVALLTRRRGCRMLGIASAVACCFGLWACCLYPLCLGTGISSLIILLGRDAKRFLDT